jgi:hypothetical protein
MFYLIYVMFYLQGTAAPQQCQEQLLGVLHDQEQHSTPEQQMTGETEQQAPEEQVILEEQEAHEETPEEQEGSWSEDGDVEGAQQGRDQQQQQINYMLVEF